MVKLWEKDVEKKGRDEDRPVVREREGGGDASDSGGFIFLCRFRFVIKIDLDIYVQQRYWLGDGVA